MNGDQCNSSWNTNKPHALPGLLINCRNGWFREFWSQHNKCEFNNNSTRKCTGMEKITDYEQEGLVPFVGKYQRIETDFKIYIASDLLIITIITTYKIAPSIN